MKWNIFAGIICLLFGLIPPLDWVSGFDFGIALLNFVIALNTYINERM